MHSRELGLVLAQQRYNDMLIAQLPRPEREVRVLDIGCGTGHLRRQLRDGGYCADGVIPAKDLCDAVRSRLAGCIGPQPRIHECRFEDFPAGQCRGLYDVTLFSESFQYISPSISLPILQAILKPGGLLLIADFFKTDESGDRGVGDERFGGGHPLREFYAPKKNTPFALLKDEEITGRVSPRRKLVHYLLSERSAP